MTGERARRGVRRAGGRRRGRNERAVDQLAAQLRRLGEYDEHTAAITTLARTSAASLDRLEADPCRSEHTVATLARVHLAVLLAARPSAGGEHDSLVVLIGDMQRAMQAPVPELEGAAEV